MLLVLVCVVLMVVLWTDWKSTAQRNHGSSERGAPTAQSTAQAAVSNQVLTVTVKPATNYVEMLRKLLDRTNRTSIYYGAAVLATLERNPELVEFGRTNAIATVERMLTRMPNARLWGLENGLPSDTRVSVKPTIGSGFDVTLRCPPLENGKGQLSFDVMGGTTMMVIEARNRPSTMNSVFPWNGSPAQGEVAGWNWRGASRPFDESVVRAMALAVLSAMGTGRPDNTPMSFVITPHIQPDPGADPAGGPYPALNQVNARYPFAFFTATVTDQDRAKRVGEGCIAQTAPGQYFLVDVFNLPSLGNPVFDLAEKFLGSPGSDAWAKAIIDKIAADPKHGWDEFFKRIPRVPPPPPNYRDGK